MIKKPTYEELEQKIQALEDTEIKQEKTDAAIHSCGERFKSFINTIQAAVVVHAADTSIICSNIEAENLLGLTENKLNGMKAIDPHWEFINIDGKKLPLDMYPVNQVLTPSTGTKKSYSWYLSS